MPHKQSSMIHIELDKYVNTKVLFFNPQRNKMRIKMQEAIVATENGTFINIIIENPTYKTTRITINKRAFMRNVTDNFVISKIPNKDLITIYIVAREILDLKRKSLKNLILI